MPMAGRPADIPLGEEREAYLVEIGRRRACSGCRSGRLWRRALAAISARRQRRSTYRAAARACGRRGLHSRRASRSRALDVNRGAAVSDRLRPRTLPARAPAGASDGLRRTAASGQGWRSPTSSCKRPPRSGWWHLRSFRSPQMRLRRATMSLIQLLPSRSACISAAWPRLAILLGRTAACRARLSALDAASRGACWRRATAMRSASRSRRRTAARSPRRRPSDQGGQPVCVVVVLVPGKDGSGRAAGSSCRRLTLPRSMN